MVYIKFLEVPDKKEGSDNYTAACKFWLQNYRGPITMGLYPKEHDRDTFGFNLDDFFFVKDSQEEEDISFNLFISVKPFYKNDESDKVVIDFGPTLVKGTKFETEIQYLEPPKEIFDPTDLDNSQYLHPLFLFREGDNIQHTYYRKDLPHNKSFMIEARYDPKKIDGTLKPAQPLATRPPMLMTLGSPTCDAKRSEIV
jgi:hypothetical protein